MAVPAFVRQSAVATGTASPLAVTITAAASGNTLIAFISNNRGSATGRTISSITATNTTGWQEVGGIGYGNSRVAIWAGVATGTTGTSVSITFSGTVASGAAAYVEEWSGILTSGTILGATATTNTNTSTSPSMNSFTPLQKDSWAGACVGAQSGTAPSASPGAPWANAKTGGANTSNIGGVTQQLNSASAQTGSWTTANVAWGTVVGELRSQTLTISVNDSITVTESATVVPQTLISVNDSSTTSESVTAVKVNIVSVNDSSSTTESVSVISGGQISVNDSITVVDKPVYPIHDNVTVTESVTLAVITNVNVVDTIATGNFYPPLEVGDLDAQTTIWLAQSFIAPFAYSIGGAVLHLSKSGSTIGAVTVSLRAADSSGLPTGSDLASGTFNGTTVLTGTPAEITTQFSPPVALTSGGNYAILVSAPSASGGAAVQWWGEFTSTAPSTQTAQTSGDSGASWAQYSGPPPFQLSLQTNATDDVTIIEVSAGNKTISVNDSSTVTESVTLAVITNVNVNDSSTVTESVVLSEATSLSVNDSSTVTENVSEKVITNISVSDSSSATESVTVVEPAAGGISVSDSSTVSEAVTLNVTTQISVSDSATVTENVSLSIISPGTVSVVDSVSVSENVDIRISSITFLVFDSSSVTEDVQIVRFTPSTGVTIEDRVNLGFRQGTSEADVLVGGFG
jgi:hypothetical protein